MTAFLAFNEFLVTIGVGVAAVSNYLIINKLWKRRDVQEVSESISVSAALLGLATGIPFFIQFLLVDQSVAGAAKQGIGIVTGVIFVMIGAGLWVPELRGRSFLRLFARSLKLEKSESGHLLKSFARPRGAEKILEILHRLAGIDRHLDEREIQLIMEFAERWKIDAPEMTAGAVESRGGLLELRETVEEYLALRPPKEQAEQLLDVIQLIARADAEVSPEEELVLGELEALLGGYASDEEDREMYEVLIVPQSDEQVGAVRELIPGSEEKFVRSGRVFSVGSFFSAAFAEVVCEKYIALGLFTVQDTVRETA